MTKRSNLALGGLFLAGIGYVAGILTAPKSGKETRQDIQRRVARAKYEAERRLKQSYADLGDLVTRGKQTAKNLSAKAKKELDQALSAAQQARDRAKEVLSAVHEGESDDADLQQAIDDADKAMTNLRKYMEKHAKTKKAA